MIVKLSRLISKILPDLWISNPLSGYHEGKFVKCKVLSIGRSGTGAVHVDLSLRSYGSNRYEKIEELKSDMIIEVNMFVLCF
ncbi:hypothetical protein Hanom_Chr03g00221211 [Helianthus anomalus]